MDRWEPYRCGIKEVWKRQIGDIQPSAFAHRIGGCQDLVQRLELYAKLDGHHGCVNTVHFSPSGEFLVSGSDDRIIVFWDWVAKLKKFSYNSGHESNVFQARVMPFSDDRSIVSCAADGQVRHAQISESGNVETKKLANHRGRAHKLAIEPGSPRTFYSCGEDGVVRHFDLREDKNTKLFTCYGFQGSSKSRRLPVVRLNGIIINPRNPHYFSVGGSDEYARVYDIRRLDADASRTDDRPVDLFTPKHLIGSSQAHITSVAYSQQEELLVSYNDELIYLFDKGMGLGCNPKLTSEKTNSDSKLEPEIYKGHRNAQTVKGVNFMGPNTEYIVSGSDCGRIFIWRKKGAKLVALMTGDSQVVNCLEPHPQATFLATSGIDKTVKVWAPTADKILALPPDAEKIMETNRRRREDRSHITITPDVIMHLLHLQRRHAQPDMERRQSHGDDGEEDEDEYTQVDFSDDDDSSEDGVHVGSQECIVS
ncbi:hypothetical protein O6H91_14G030900 [Diphasiastrum complanatum]|uniref:Uncharacterized protein n=2 Tax=Diphasiastrum complanatum TaxID=34168 RepID=A0ACC2BMQ6_DIPCM|nr:hypothetical protein O6H91_14G030900 [Diphasiastrum complanatum]KAJ7531059.1 hypothetical protein O6H91_14G030900 [Diphasiastrum complanatum]